MSDEPVRSTSPAMGRFLVVASLLVLGIGTPLFLVPSETDTLFSWTVNPPLTAAFLGAAYWSAFLLEVLAARERVWARSRIAVPAVLAFTTMTLVATLIHLDKFHFGSEFSPLTRTVTWIWLVVYAVVPPVLAVLWWLQGRRRGPDPARMAPLPSALKGLLAVQAAVMLPLGVALFVSPTAVGAAVWPWSLSALTGRAIGAWLIGVGLAAAHSVWENDLVRLSGAFVSYIAMGVLELVALLRFAGADHPVSGDPVLDWAAGRSWIYLVFVIGVGVAGLWGWVAGRRVRSEPVPSAPR